MGIDKTLHQLTTFIGFDEREPAASEVAEYSIRKRTKYPVVIQHLKHKDLRKVGLFLRPWLTDARTGLRRDLIDGNPFSTEFSHTRFLIPELMGFKGWALFMDADMMFLSDIKKLFELCDDSKAVMCVKHNHHIKGDTIKMDGQVQQGYNRKNWSSFVLWNCGHEANKQLTKGFVNTAKGSDLHSFSWLANDQIGELPHTYNYISGVSPKLPLEMGARPHVIHYTEGGPWFSNCRNVPYAQFWLDEYEEYQANRDEHFVTNVPTMAYDK